MSLSSARFWIASPIIQRDAVSGAILKWLAKGHRRLNNLKHFESCRGPQIMPTTELIESFSEFAKAKVDQAGNDLSIDDLYDEWRTQHPPADDLLAIKASLRDMENGDTGRSFDDFAAEFRRQNGIRETP